MKIIDIKGKELEIKSIEEGIAEADTYLWFTDASKNKELFEYWYHIKSELEKIKEQENNS